MENGFLYPIRVKTRLSPWLFAIIYGAHAISLGVLPGLSFSWIIRSVLSGCVIYSLYRFDARYRRRNDPGYPEEIQLNRYDEWSMKLPDGEFRPAVLLPRSFVHPRLVVLRFQVGRKHIPVLLTPDVSDPEQLRRLRVRIKYRKTSPAQDASINA